MSTPITVRAWNVKTGAIINDISIGGPRHTTPLGIQRMVTIFMGENLYIYDGLTGAQLSEGELLPSRNHQLGGRWIHGESLRFAQSFRADGRPTIGIYELYPTSNPLLRMVKSFHVPPHDGKFSFCPVSFHASFVTDTGITIFNVQDSTSLFCTKAIHPLYTPPGRFSPDGTLFTCGTLKNEICVWKNTSTGYVRWSSLSPQLPFAGFTISSTATLALSWGSQGFEVLHPGDSMDKTGVETPRQGDSVVSRRVVIDPSEMGSFIRLPYAHEHAVELLVRDMYPRIQGSGYQHRDQRACLPGTRETIMEMIKLWADGPDPAPIFCLNGPAGTGKTTIIQAIVEWCDAQGLLVSHFSCSPGANQRGRLRLLFPTLAFQLGQKRPAIRSILVSLLDFNAGVVYESPSNQLEELIVKPLMSVDVPALIIVDALDEWIDAVSQSAIFSAIERCTKRIPKVKFLITSRPKYHILGSIYLPFLQGRVRLVDLYNDIPLDSVNSDIRLFLKHELSDLASKNELENWPTDAQLDLLTERAEGLFAYAFATTKYLGRKHTTPSEQYAILARSRNTIHEGTVEGVHGGLSLDSLFISILQEAFKNDDHVVYDAVVRSVLAAVVLAPVPLPPSAIAVLTCLKVEKVMAILSAIQPLLRLEGDPDQPVHPLHTLLRDLLTSTIRCPDKKFYISPGKFHSEITLNCLKVMIETREDDFSLQTSTKDSEVRYSHALVYARKNWHTHLAGASEDINHLLATLHRFLEDLEENWLNNLTAEEAASAQNTIISWLRDVRFGLS